MKKKSTLSVPTFVFTILLMFSFGNVETVKAFNHVSLGTATYTNGSYSTTFNIPCQGYIQIPGSGTITFDVEAKSTTNQFLTLSLINIPPGATFPTVSGFSFVQSTFTWTLQGSALRSLTFACDPLEPEFWCEVDIDWPLPVELSSFNSVINGNNIDLKWTTSQETNNSGFEIQRSSENSDWSKIGFVNGNGTTVNSNNYTFTERNLSSGRYNYRLKQIDFNGNFEYHNLSNDVAIGTPDKFELSQNYPNPFNPSTKINYSLPKDGFVSVKVFDALGKEVKTLVYDFKSAGYNSIDFSGTNLSSGLYFYKIETEGSVKVMKMSLIK